MYIILTYMRFPFIEPVSLTSLAPNNISVEYPCCCESIRSPLHIFTNTKTTHLSSHVQNNETFIILEIVMRTERNSHRIWIATEISLVQRSPVIIDLVDWFPTTLIPSLLPHFDVTWPDRTRGHLGNITSATRTRLSRGITAVNLPLQPINGTLPFMMSPHVARIGRSFWNRVSKLLK